MSGSPGAEPARREGAEANTFRWTHHLLFYPCRLCPLCFAWAPVWSCYITCKASHTLPVLHYTCKRITTRLMSLAPGFKYRPSQPWDGLEMCIKFTLDGFIYMNVYFEWSVSYCISNTVACMLFSDFSSLYLFIFSYFYAQFEQLMCINKSCP